MKKISDDHLKTVKQYLKMLKLFRMEHQLDEVLKTSEKENTPTILVLKRLLEIEGTDLINRRIERRIRESKLPERKLLSDFDRGGASPGEHLQHHDRDRPHQLDGSHSVREGRVSVLERAGFRDRRAGTGSREYENHFSSHDT